MRRCSVLAAHLFTLILLASRAGCVGGTGGGPSNETDQTTPTAAERRKAAFSRIARSAATLFDTKITNRGGDGTVVKDLDRGEQPRPRTKPGRQSVLRANGVSPHPHLSHM